MRVEAVSRAHDTPLAPLVVEELFIGYKHVLGDSKASLVRVEREFILDSSRSAICLPRLMGELGVLTPSRPYTAHLSLL